MQRQSKRDFLKSSTVKTKSGREKKLDRKDSTLKRDAAREVAMLRFKQGVVVSAAGGREPWPHFLVSVS